jgi:hypothetical protein
MILSLSKCLLFGLLPGLLAPGVARAAESVKFHSHNDYLHERPLWDALKAGVTSVEADVWKFWSGLYVSHFPLFGKSGSLEGWYLDPWRKAAAQEGVMGWRQLWMDIKGPDGAVQEALVSTLREVLGGYEAHSPRIILTGNDEAKKAIAHRLSGERGLAGKFEIDRREFDRLDPPRNGPADPWGWYSLSWSEHFTWDGKGCIPSTEWGKLNAQIAAIHSKGRSVRYFHVPSTLAWVRVAHEAGVDLIDVDDLSLPGRLKKENPRAPASVCPRI